MTDLESGAVGPQDGTPGWDDLADGSVERARELFVVLGKAFRAFQLYDENNPVRQRFLESLRRAFEAMWTETDRLKAAVEEDRILLGEDEVYHGESRSDSLAFLFFKDGVREITFLPGIETSELVPFLAVLQRARKLMPEGDDLLTVLWEQDFQYFQYQYVDFLSEGGAGLPIPGGGATADELRAVLDAEVEEEEETAEESSSQAGGDQPAPSTINRDDFNPTLYSLDPREMQTLEADLHKELTRDLRGDVLTALFDRLEEPERPARQSEILEILRTLLPNFLSRGGLIASTHVLEELRRLEAEPGVFDDERREASRNLLDEVSASDTIGELIQALYDGSVRATPDQLAAFLRFLRAGALAPLVRAAETVEHRELRSVLRSAVKGIAERNRRAVVDLLERDDPIVACGAARLAGDMQIADAGPALARLLAHADPNVRLAAVEAASALRASTAAGALQHTLNDPERDIRVAAARALGTLRYGPAGKQLAEILGSREIREADITEKVAFFEAYGLVAGESSVSTLDKLLNRRTLFGKREPPEIRAAAALALGKVSADAARDALNRALRQDDPVVRSAVHRALRSE